MMFFLSWTSKLLIFFPSACKTSLSISYPEGLLAMNNLFHLIWKYLYFIFIQYFHWLYNFWPSIFPKHLKDVVSLYSILYSFWWEITYHFPLYVVSHFILITFKVFSLSLMFTSLTLLGVVDLLASVKLYLPPNWGHFQSLFCYPILSLLLLGLPSHTRCITGGWAKFHLFFPPIFFPMSFTFYSLF